MDMDTLVLRLMAHGRTLQTRISVIEEDETLRRGALCVRPSRDGVRIDVLRMRHESEGEGTVIKTVAPDQALAVAKAEMEQMNRLWMRAKSLAISAHAIDAPPSWSLCADLLATSLLKGIGLRPYEALNPVNANWNRMPGRLERDIHHPRLEDTSVIRHGARCDVRMTVHTNAAKTVGPGTMWYSDVFGSVPTLTVASRTALPETSMAAAAGRPLAMIMVIPGVVPETIVRSMSCTPADHGYSIVVQTEPLALPLLPAPDGTDTSWLQAA